MRNFPFDERRNIMIPGNHAETIDFSINFFFKTALDAIENHDYFSVALSGGSTPREIFQGILKSEKRKQVDWKKVFLFWGDERCVPLDHPDSNYRMAMEAGFNQLEIPQENIFPMQTSGDLDEAAKEYENVIRQKIPSLSFDLIMLGMGEDGHTASLFPKTHGLHPNSGWLVVPNFIPEKNIWRMTLTFECINAASHIVIFVLGANKAKVVEQVLMDGYDPDKFPIQKIGTIKKKSLWVLDEEAAKYLA